MFGRNNNPNLSYQQSSDSPDAIINQQINQQVQNYLAEYYKKYGQYPNQEYILQIQNYYMQEYFNQKLRSERLDAEARRKKKKVLIGVSVVFVCLLIFISVLFFTFLNGGQGLPKNSGEKVFVPPKKNLTTTKETVEKQIAVQAKKDAELALQPIVPEFDKKTVLQDDVNKVLLYDKPRVLDVRLCQTVVDGKECLPFYYYDVNNSVFHVETTAVDINRRLYDDGLKYIDVSIKVMIFDSALNLISAKTLDIQREKEKELSVFYDIEGMNISEIPNGNYLMKVSLTDNANSQKDELDFNFKIEVGDVR